MRTLIGILLLSLALVGCGSKDQVTGSDSMEQTLKDAQKETPPGEAKPWVDKSAGNKAGGSTAGQ
jgi:hypothetical protein